MTPPTIRFATAADDAPVGELLVEAFREAYRRKMPEVVLPPERLSDLRNTTQKRLNASVLVAETEGSIVGTVMILKPGAAGTEAWIPNAADLRQLAVGRAWQGLGVASALLDAAESLAWSWKAEAICVHTRRGAVGVAEVYRKRGYVRTPAGDFEGRAVTLEAHLKLRPNR